MLPTSGSKGGEALTHWRDCGNEEEEEEEEEKEKEKEEEDLEEEDLEGLNRLGG